MYSSPYIPTIDPVILHIYGPFAIRWYSLAYIAGILFTVWHSKKITARYNLNISHKNIDELTSLSILAIIIGGRLGHVFIYEPMEYIQSPLEILKIYEGGMAFHGAVAGLAAAFLYYGRKHKIQFLSLTDMVLSSASFGVFFGRLANFINGEIYGKPTDKWWGVIFDMGGNVARHPSQLYEAFFVGLILLLITLYYTHMREKIKDVGFITALWCMLYSGFRFMIEFYKVPDGMIFNLISTGQLLSIITFLIGFYIFTSKKNEF